MGYPIDSFINPKVNEEFICAICTDVLKNPVCLADCDHMFCNDCISEWLRTHKTCPIDRNEISEADYVHVQKPFLNLLNQLEVNCSYANQGCVAVINIGNLEHHLAICEFKFSPEYKTICEFGCGAELPATMKSSHNCVEYLLEVIKLIKSKNGHEETPREVIVEVDNDRSIVQGTSVSRKDENLSTVHAHSSKSKSLKTIQNFPRVTSGFFGGRPQGEKPGTTTANKFNAGLGTGYVDGKIRKQTFFGDLTIVENSSDSETDNLEWACPVCTFKNFQLVEKCIMCYDSLK